MAYNIPRDTKGESRILLIFSTKALIYTGIGIAVGSPFYFILKVLNLGTLGLIIMAIFGLIGFIIATFKVPRIAKIPMTKDISGEQIDEAIKRLIKFKMKKTKHYVLYRGEENKWQIMN